MPPRGIPAILLVLAASAWGEMQFTGRVLSSTKAPVKGARVLLEPEAGPALQAFSDVEGKFTLSVAPGPYRLTVDHDRHFPIVNQTIRIEESAEPAVFTLEPLREVRESVEVAATPIGIDMESTSGKRAVSANEILNTPFPNSNDFRQSLRIIPGVIRDNRGALHINGGGEEQMMYTLNGFNVTDPITGRFESRLSTESVQTAEVNSGSIPAEFGRGSAGTLAIRTTSGDDKLRYSATNFFPGIENRKGLTVGDWTPRANLSGPLLRGRAWFSDSLDVLYVNTVIRDLPKGQDRYSSTRLSNLFHTQVNLSPRNILYSSFLFNRFQAGRTGLSALDPLQTTIDRRSRQWFATFKDQIYLPGRGLIEFGYGANRTFSREQPQGDGFLAISPEGRSGYYYVNGTRDSSRDQFMLNGFAPSFEVAGTHSIKSGFDLDRVNYHQDIHRTGYENYSADGILIRRTVYGGSGLLDRANYEAAWYAQDSWRIRPSLLIELGIRTDWSNLLRRWDWSPRFGFAWNPPGLRNTKIYGGYAHIFDATNLRLFSRPLDQYALTTYYDPFGGIRRGPSLTLFSIDNPNLKRPRYQNLTAGIEQAWQHSLVVRAEYMRRRGARGFSYLNSYNESLDPLPAWLPTYRASDVDFLFNLTNFRRDEYDSYSLSIRHNIRRLYEWMVSYTYSQAVSNTVVDVAADDPIVVTNNVGRMPWDAPHRLLSWGYLPTPVKNWAVAYMLDARSGFPFSFVNQDGRIQGPVNVNRYPMFFEANIHLERRFKFRGYLWAFRFGANNVTNRINPDSVNNVIGAPQFRQFFGGNGRSTNFRVRWLGRAQ